MKFTIEGFSQAKLVEYGLDSRDATFLRWFVDFQATGKMKQHDVDGRFHYWIEQSHLAEDMPILGLKDANSVRKYLSRLCEKDILSRHNIARGNGETMQGSAAYYAINGDLLESLITDHRHEYTDGKGEPPVQAYRSDPSSNNKSTKQQQEGEESGSTTYYVDRSRQAPAPADIAAAQKTAPEVRTRIEPEVTAEDSAPEYSGKSPEAPEVSKLSTSDYLLKLNEIARNNATRDLTVAENTEAVKLGKRHGSKAVIAAWWAYLEKRAGRGFTLFLRDVTDFTDYKPKPNTLDAEYKQAVEHRDEILTDENDTEITGIAAAFFANRGGRPSEQKKTPFWMEPVAPYSSVEKTDYKQKKAAALDAVVQDVKKPMDAVA